jgi:hypothetical protein
MESLDVVQGNMAEAGEMVMPSLGQFFVQSLIQQMVSDARSMNFHRKNRSEGFAKTNDIFIFL